MTKDEIIKRIDWIVSLGDNCLKNLRQEHGDMYPWSSTEYFYPFKAAIKQFFLDIAGEDSPYWKELNKGIVDGKDYSIRMAINLLQQFKVEIEHGFLEKLESKITGEVFTGFLEMAEYFIGIDCDDAAAVMAGGVLEGHLKKMCVLNGIDLTTVKDGKTIAKGANWLNNDLRKANVYDRKEFNSVNVMLEIRNDAAHTDIPIIEKTRARQLVETTKLFITRFSL
jgi:hypothetical protein